MSGFAARTAAATGMHDPLTVRAVAVGDTAIVCADVIGLHEDSCRRIRERCSLQDDKVVVSSLHTHGGPVTMPGRLGDKCDVRYLSRLEDACVEAIETAIESRRPAQLYSGLGADPEVAQNRRHAKGRVDPNLPVLGIKAENGNWLALIASYACHPVVLGADNTLWTADYPGFVRQKLEAAYPGAIGLFLPGCAGDTNTGHRASDSFEVGPSARRTFEEAERVGALVAASAVAAKLERASNANVSCAAGSVDLELERRELAPLQQLAEKWAAESAAFPSRRALLQSWIKWTEIAAQLPLSPWKAEVTVLNWGGIPIVALPGEIFAETALDIRSGLGTNSAFVLCFCNGCPGYIPPISEYQYGGYEVDEAHRYYGMPATFAPGSAERLVSLAHSLSKQIGVSK